MDDIGTFIRMYKLWQESRNNKAVFGLNTSVQTICEKDRLRLAGSTDGIVNFVDFSKIARTPK